MIRQYLLFLFISVFLLPFAKSQIEDTNIAMQQKVTETPNTIRDQQMKIAEQYDLESDRPKNGKILNEVQLLKNPNPGQGSLNITIPEGEIVEIYRYFGNQGSWAIKYQDIWGFVEAKHVLPVHKVEEEDESEFDVPPKLKSSIEPDYPTEAKEAGIKGRVYLSVYINEKGKATDAKIIKGIPELNEAAIEAVKKARYSPAELDGKSVGVWINLSINFK